MHEFRRAGVLGLVFLAMGMGCAYAVDDEEKPSKADIIEIPLDQIWALDMPRTRDVHEIVKVDTKHVPPRSSVLDRIVRSPSFRRNKQMPGYAVPGKPNRNLIWASKALWKRNDLGPLPTTEDVNLTFFAQVSSYRVHLLSVQRDGFEIHIEYRFEPQRTSEAQVSFALIPLGKIPAGQYHVKVHQAPMKQEYLDAGFEPVNDEQASRLVSGPFSFDVWEPPAPDPGPNQNAIEIPLDEIWAWQMPGNRPLKIGQGHDGGISAEGQLLDEIRRSLEELLPNKGEASSGFTVLGTGPESLSHAHGVLVKKEEPSKIFSSDREISLVFFSYRMDWHAYLHRVEREGNRIEIRYRFAPRLRRRASEHFALIPLGRLPCGKYHVNIVRSPMEQQYVDRRFNPVHTEWERRVVCKSFSFSVVDETGKVSKIVDSSHAAKNDENSGKSEVMVIPLDQIWGYHMPSTKDIEKHLAPKSYGRTLETIYRSLQADRQGKAAQPGFAVTGNLDSVIEQMHQVLVEREKPKLRFQADSQMSLVFFAYESGWYVQLKEVQRKGAEIRIRYQFVPHESADSAVHLAMIPFGKLSPRKYSVRIEQVPVEKRFTEVGFTSPDAKLSKQLISQSFSFAVTK